MNGVAGFPPVAVKKLRNISDGTYIHGDLTLGVMIFVTVVPLMRIGYWETSKYGTGMWSCMIATSRTRVMNLFMYKRELKLVHDCS